MIKTAVSSRLTSRGFQSGTQTQASGPLQ